MCSLFEVVL